MVYVKTQTTTSSPREGEPTGTHRGDYQLNTRQINTATKANTPANRLNTVCILSKVLIQALCRVPAGSPSRGGDVVVYVFNINQPSLPTPFNSVLVSVSVLLALSTVFHSINSPDNSPLSHSVVLRSYLSALLVLSTLYLFMKVSLSPDMILCG